MASLLEVLPQLLPAFGMGVGGLLGGIVGGYRMARKRLDRGDVGAQLSDAAEDAPTARSGAHAPVYVPPPCACAGMKDELADLRRDLDRTSERLAAIDALREAHLQIQHQLAALLTTAAKTAEVAAYLHGRMDAHAPAPASPPRGR